MCEMLDKMRELMDEMREILAERERSIENLIALARAELPCANCETLKTMEETMTRIQVEYAKCAKALTY